MSEAAYDYHQPTDEGSVTLLDIEVNIHVKRLWLWTISVSKDWVQPSEIRFRHLKQLELIPITYKSLQPLDKTDSVN